MAGVNKVIIVGNLGQDPEIKTFNNGGKVANLSVATSETWKDRQTGEKREKTEWHRVVVQAEHAVKYAEQYLRKGSKVYIEGKLETRKWQDQSGADRYATEIVIKPFGGELQGLSSAQDGEGRGNGGGRPYGGGYDREDDRGWQRSGGNGGGGAQSRQDLDDEIPF